MICDQSIENYHHSILKIDGIIESIENRQTDDVNVPNIRAENRTSNSSKLTYHFSKEEFINSVRIAKKYITEGDVMQVVLSQRISVGFKQILFFLS